MKMANFNHALNDIFKVYKNLHRKYEEINFSLFNKAHIEHMQKKMSNRLILLEGSTGQGDARKCVSPLDTLFANPTQTMVFN